jgi:ubiquinone biosynthesis monooxygenase Coq7
MFDATPTQAAPGTAHAAANLAVPAWLWAELRSDHAGEAGAVEIYRGIRAVCRDSEVRRFALHHEQTERRHLQLIEAVVPRPRRSRLLPVWRLAGWLTGALPALFGARAVYRTIAAVETFVDHHYAAQTRQLAGLAPYRALHDLLEACRLDEVAHRDDAARRTAGRPSLVARVWHRLVGAGSEAGVALAKRF